MVDQEGGSNTEKNATKQAAGKGPAAAACLAAATIVCIPCVPCIFCGAASMRNAVLRDALDNVQVNVNAKGKFLSIAQLANDARVAGTEAATLNISRFMPNP